MPRTLARLTLLAAVLALAPSAAAATITLDMNGFANRAGGHVAGPGIERPLKWEPGAAQVSIPNVQAGGRYHVDFYHNSGPLGSDFSFTVNEAGTGVAAVEPMGGADMQIVKGFRPGDTTLKLNTFKIVYNAGGTQTAHYFIQGLIDAHTLPAMSGPQELIAVPGLYSVDNLHNPGGGLEDYRFVVTGRGTIAAAPAIPAQRATETTPAQPQRPGTDEYTEYRENQVRPRAVMVRFVIDASEPVNFHTTHRRVNEQREGRTTEFDMVMTVGPGGVNVYSFGENTVSGSDAVGPAEEPMKGVRRENDFTFMPRLRYDVAKQTFYFVSDKGPARSVSAAAAGTFDGGEKPLTVKVTATIQPEMAIPPVATQPATQPAGG